MRSSRRVRALMWLQQPLALCLLAAGSATAQTTLPPAQPSDWAHPTGAYAVVMEEDAGLPDHTIYRPADLAALQPGHRLPIVAFSGPGCDANGTAFRPFFTEVASHGFLLIVSGPPEPRGGSGPNFPKTEARDLTAAIDWAVAENGRAGSLYSGRIDTSRVAIMGQSCGGAQSLAVSGDPRIDTIVMWNSTSFTSGPTGRGPGPGAPGGPPGGESRAVAPQPSGAPPARQAPPAAGAARARGGRGGIPVPRVDAAQLQNLQVPIAYFIGGKRDILYGGSVADIPKFENAPVFWASLDIQNQDPHAGTFREPNGGEFGRVGVAWLKWRLNGDTQAARLFQGADCTLCRDSRWEVRTKNMK